MNSIENIEKAISEIRKGKLIIVIDDKERENEGDLICSAELITPEQLNFIATYAKGLICLPISHQLAKKLNFYPMVENNTDNHQTAFTVSVDHIETSTGISAFDRALTSNKCCDDNSKPSDFRRPGHMFPLIAKEGGVLERNGHTEATVDLMKLAKLKHCGICCEIMDDDGTMMKYDKLIEFSKKWDLVLISIKELQEYIKIKGF